MSAWISTSNDTGLILFTGDPTLALHGPNDYVSLVPEPSSLVFAPLGLFGLLTVAWRCRIPRKSGS